MKLILSSILTFFTLTISAQLLDIPSELNINERAMILDKVERNGFSIQLEGEEKEVLKQFADYTESAWDVKVKSRSSEVSGEDLLSTSFSDKHFGINAYFVESDQGNELRFFARFGTDIFVNSKDYPKEAANAQKHLRAFAKKYYGDYIDEQLEEKKDDLKDSEKDLLGIKKDISKEEKSKLKEQEAIKKLEKDNVKIQDKIRKYQDDIEENKADIVKANAEIESIQKETSELKTKQDETAKAVTKYSSEVSALMQMLTFVKGF